jgi:hypothetical protein
MRIVEGIRARRFESRLRGALAQSTSREAHFHGLAGRLAASSGLCWAGLVSWQAAELTGAIELEASEGAAGPTETALVSWLLRETETREDVIAAAEAELGVEGRFAAIPLRRGDAIEAYLVLGFDHSLSRSVELALRACIGELSAVLLGPDRTALPAVRRPLAAVS